MKANKALKRLAKIEASLSVLIERYAVNQSGVQELLHDAKASVLRAKKAVSLQASPKTATNASVRAGKSKRRQATAEARKRASLAANKRRPVQTKNKAARKAGKKSPTPVAKAVRTKTAGPTVAKKAPVKQLVKKAAAVASFRKVKNKILASVGKQTVAERTKTIVERPEQAVDVPEIPTQNRTTTAANVGLTGVKSGL